MSFPTATLHVHLGRDPLPDWGEYAPFLWGDGVNYDGDGNAYDPSQRTYWTILDISHRNTGGRLLIRPLPLPDLDNPPFYRDANGKLQFFPARTREQVSMLSIEGDDFQSVRLAAYLTAFRSGGTVVEPETERVVPLSKITETIPDLSVRFAAADKVRLANGIW